MSAISQPQVRTVIILCAGLTAHVLAEWFKNVEPDWRSTLVAPLRTGLVAGCAIALTTFFPGPLSVTIASAAILVLAAAYLERKGLHSEALDGLLTGSIASFAAAGVQTLVPGGEPSLDAARLLLCGAFSGFTISFIASRWAISRAWTAAAVTLPAIAVAWLPTLLATRFGQEQIAAATALAPPAAVVVAVFARWPVLRKELRKEATLGMVDASEVDSVANPVRRLFARGWPDRAARRRFVSTANTLAIRKRQQRVAAPALQRLYQLEILKLRMELQQAFEIHLAVRRSNRDRITPNEDVSRSDTIPAKGRPG